MVRNTTTEHKQDRAYAQWIRAWELLDAATRLAIIAFCTRSDADVAEFALMV